MRLIIALCLCICVAFACDQLWSSSVVPCGQSGFDCPPGVTPPSQDLSMPVSTDGGELAMDMTGQPPEDLALGGLVDASGLELPVVPLPDLTIPVGTDMKVIIVSN